VVGLLIIKFISHRGWAGRLHGMDDFIDEAVNIRSVNACVYDDVSSFDFFSYEQFNHNSINILNLNIRSYNKHIDELMIILNSYCVKFDIIVLTETWTDERSVIVSMDGYDVFVSKCSRNQNDGVIVYVNNCFAVCDEDVCLFGATSIRLNITFGGEQLCLIAVYRTPSAQLEPFIDDLELFLTNRSRDRAYWLVGDINCCILPGNQNQTAQKYLDALYEAGFISCIDIPTRITANTESCIDHIFTDLKDTGLIRSAVIRCDMTDHDFTVCQIPCKNNTSLKGRKVNVSSLDECLASQLISVCDWSAVTSIDDVNSSCCVFVEKLQNVIAQSIKFKHISSKCTKLKPWISSGLINSIRHRDKLSKKLKKQPFNVTLRAQYKNYRNQLSCLIKSAKENYYRNKIIEVRNNNKMLWRNITEIIGLSKKERGFPIEHFMKGKTNIHNKDILQAANTLNEYYVGVGASLASAVPPVSEYEVNDANHVTDSNFRLMPISDEDLVCLIKNLKGGSAPGVDNIPASLIKKNVEFLKKPLLHIINNSILQGIFPNLFKIGKVIPIYKAGPKNHFVSYRPITLASVLSKLIEAAVRQQLENYLIINNILYQNQFGFRKDKNLNDNLFLLTKQIHNAIEHNKKALLVFIDLAKAFDTVDRGLLLNKLEYIGVQGTSLKWFADYLSDRSQVVSILNQTSVAMNIDYGVIQGSTLGPLLFLVYINNLGKLKVDNGHIFLYADDTALLFHGDCWEEVYDSAERGLASVKRWFDQNRLTINLQKTKCLPISIRADGDPVDRCLRLHVCGAPRECITCECVERVSEYKYLGVIFDNRLRWAPHVQYVRNKLRKFIFIFSTLSRILTPDLVKQIYYAYIQSLLQYGIIAWGGGYKTVLSPLSIIQKIIIKTALNRPRMYSTDALFQEFKVSTVTQLYIKTLILYIYKRKSTLFCNIEHNYLTRSAINVGIIAPKLIKTFTSTSSHYKINILFPKLPENIRCPETERISSFKKIVSKWMSGINHKELEEYLISIYSS
jgi:hypothetical protein